jgi:hypothetical protein
LAREPLLALTEVDDFGIERLRGMRHSGTVVFDRVLGRGTADPGENMCAGVEGTDQLADPVFQLLQYGA